MRLPKMKKTLTVLLSSLTVTCLLNKNVAAMHGAAVANTKEGQCSSRSSFYCPNCGGYQVSDCLECDGYLSSDINHKICFNRKLFNARNENDQDYENHYHHEWNDLLGTFVWLITAGVAIACGVGGGGVYLPMGILLLQFAPKQTSGLTQASIFGAGLGGILINAQATHPNTKIRHDPAPDRKGEEQLSHQLVLTKKQERQYIKKQGGKFYTRPVVHYDMALFLSPMQMAGAVLGVLVQKVLPNWLYVTLAAIVLGITSRKTFQKYWSARAKEDQAASNSDDTQRSEPNAQDVSTGEPSSHCLTTTSSHGLTTASTSAWNEDDYEAPTNEMEDQKNDDAQSLELRKKYLEEDMEQYPLDQIGGLLSLWVGLFLLTLVKGGKGLDSILGITCKDTVYLVLVAVQFLWLFGFSLFFGLKAKHKQELRRAVNYPFLPHDPIWTTRSLRQYGMLSFVAGVVAGLVGTGGAMVMGPLLLMMDVHPSVVTATNATMSVLTSSSIAVMFVISGLVPWPYALYFFFICFIGALYGKSRIDGYVKRTGRASLLIFILASIIAFATLGCLIILLMGLAEAEWCFAGFNEFCDADSDDDGGSCFANRALSVLAAGTTTTGNTFLGH